MGSPEDARAAPLSRLIDHAPLYPPASLDLASALAEDRRARESPASFIQARERGLPLKALGVLSL